MAGKGRASTEDMARIEAAVLMCIAERVGAQRGKGATGRSVSLSRGELSRAIGVSAYRVGAAAARLAEQGLITCEASFGENGSQRGNSLALTEMGAWYARGIAQGKEMAEAR